MSGEIQGGQTLRQTRQVTIDALCERFANDAMGMEEFERRIDEAHRATTVDQLKDLLRDLPGGNVPAVAEAPATSPTTTQFSVARPDQVRNQGFVVAVFGGSARRGRWRPARNNYSVAVFGGTELDFREAILAPGVTELRVVALWGGIKIIVPPELNVESHGLALLGGFDHAGSEIGDPDPDAPTLRITGVACMGGVEVAVRLPGESSRDARRRHRERRRELRRKRHRGLGGRNRRESLPPPSEEDR